MKRAIYILPALLLGILLLQTGCAVRGESYYRYQGYDWYPYGGYYWWPYDYYPDRDYRFRYAPRHREHDHDHFIGRPRYDRSHEERERHEQGERYEGRERGGRHER